ncbi:hypothetical protein [uncultured Aquimarina sp.]|uniref:hypothetical protein n=1 Tax=uncultured Aquimarina sp. TaxID=575652 RepID=UPI00260A09B0|nr:hypothetical protein [uncultured Aquimarina sp.]
MRKLLLTSRSIGGAYILFYFSFLIVILVAIFLDEEYLIFTKPLVPISLILVHISNVKSINLYYVASMLVILVNDTLIYLDFATYFDLVAIIIVTFYLLCIFLLKKYIALADLQIKKFITFPIVISLALISYLIFSISQLVLPSLMDSFFLFFMILIVLLLFVAACFFVYITDKYEGNFRLFISASCCLFVNALLLINYFYFHTRVFTILINIAEIAGLYFFLRFLMEAKPINLEYEKDKYF